MRSYHLRAVHTIDCAVYPRPWSVAMFRQELDLTDSRYYVVAVEAGVVRGHAGVMYVGSEGHVTTVAVDPAMQSQGVATRLMIDLCRHGIRRRADALTLEVRVKNERAIALYRRFGFAPAGIRKNYYSETNEDALVMWAHDIQQPAYVQRLASIEEGLN